MVMTRFDATSAQRLQYAARGKSPRRRRMLVFFGVVILLCAVTPVAVHYAKVGADRMRTKRLYRDCAAYVAPANAPVWEEEPQRMKQLHAFATVGSRNGDA